MLDRTEFQDVKQMKGKRPNEIPEKIKLLSILVVWNTEDNINFMQDHWSPILILWKSKKKELKGSLSLYPNPREVSVLLFLFENIVTPIKYLEENASTIVWLVWNALLF